MGTWYSLHYMRVSELIEVISAPFFLHLMPLAFPASICLPSSLLPPFLFSPFSLALSLSLPLSPPSSPSLSVSLSICLSISLCLCLSVPLSCSPSFYTFSRSSHLFLNTSIHSILWNIRLCNPPSFHSSLSSLPLTIRSSISPSLHPSLFLPIVPALTIPPSLSREAAILVSGRRTVHRPPPLSPLSTAGGRSVDRRVDKDRKPRLIRTRVLEDSA